MTNELTTYKLRYESTLVPLAERLEEYLRDLLSDTIRIDRINARAKSVDQFIKKSKTKKGDGEPKYEDPLHQIQDQIGARIITFYQSDVHFVEDCLLKYMNPIEKKFVTPDDNWKFGYFGRHHVIIMPEDIRGNGLDDDEIPDFFELQIKTLFQHAWSEANHDLGYKPGNSQWSDDDLRKLAFASAQAWGADQIFEELFSKNSS